MSDVKFRKAGEGAFAFLDAKCIEADCWAPAEYHSRGATGGSGSRATGNVTKCCVRRAYHGCPTPIVHDAELGAQRRKDGWKKA